MCLSNAVNTKRTKNTNQAFLKHESPLMEPGDKSHPGECESVSFRVCVGVCVQVLTTSMHEFMPRDYLLS